MAKNGILSAQNFSDETSNDRYIHATTQELFQTTELSSNADDKAIFLAFSLSTAKLTRQLACQRIGLLIYSLDDFNLIR